jgi:hypothetical protein
MKLNASLFGNPQKEAARDRNDMLKGSDRQHSCVVIQKLPVSASVLHHHAILKERIRRDFYMLRE